MTEPILLGIGGYAFAGKDAVANFLVDDHSWYKTYMSKPLEKALLALDPFIEIHKENTPQICVRYSAVHSAVGYDQSKKFPEVRRLLQTLGTEVGRNMFSDTVWLDLVMEEAKTILASGINVCVTGIRFLNELEAVEEAGGTTLWVHRPGVRPVNAHVSDNTLDGDNFQLVLSNNGTLDDLQMATAALNDKLLKKRLKI